ncbi:YajG family lipoprotein [Corallincola platygyrae]|uniref:YajG family lipoprotein n=1 Tax=Corallincola platygyrae TaxID=1193278 RepID=A0ABW4XJH9_9GAMM
MKSLVLASFALLLSACSTQYAPMIVNPVIKYSGQTWQQSQPVSLQVQDMRPAQYLAKIDGSSEKVTLVPASNSITAVVEEKIRTAYQQHGIELNSEAAIKTTIELHSALVDVTKPGHFDYKMDTHVKIRVKVEKTDTTFSKMFRGKRSTMTNIKPDTAALEQELNALLARVLKDLADDKEVQQFIAVTETTDTAVQE